MGTEEGLDRHRVSKGRVNVVDIMATSKRAASVTEWDCRRAPQQHFQRRFPRCPSRICQTAVAPGGPTAMRPPEDPATQPASSTSASADVSAPNPPDVRVLRVSQIDAGRLDVEHER